MNISQEDKWDQIITAKSSLFDLNLKEAWRYRDLLRMFVKRDIITVYKQTILGPLWYFIQPLFTAITFTIIFNRVAGIETGKVPSFLFNLAGIIVWNYFTSCLNETADTFKKNANIFGKVYFPRIIMPLSTVITNLLKLGIQIIIYIGFYLFYLFLGMKNIINFNVIFFPFLIILMGLLGLGLGMIISSLVTKYRDLSFLISFGVQLLMYISAVVYPIELISQKLPKYGWLVEYNPLAYIVETSRIILLNQGEISIFGLVYTIFVTIMIFVLGLVIFNKTEKSFIDTV
ncbi:MULTISPECIES: ABC transporter permease [Flavobacterium]|uniref:Transport permease protein n=2 Tax=Flavobacterium TaxID=237 RepID=A0AA94F2D0_9FLAO|nr:MULTISPECIES: ABC transporter permease [Flavobacterium]OXA83859.1 ABC transporter permease [Flavobacterium columnare] [Flavobacterium columnare NBRC 100251 = ATCC 23463]AMA49824.1 ABC transporter permease [Flavobacterium covae]AND64648.1 ABC transporter permease [Flavobacterium covae]MCH4829032.1 ABC transporter permease [Flavobacterium columnare]MCH4833806.1 ABC transporter permease [Flavobacterium columnare]